MILKKDKAMSMLPDEWGALFIHWLWRNRGYSRKKYHEISNKKLINEANRFVAMWMREIKNAESLNTSCILDSCFNNRWLEVSAANTFVIRRED